MQLSAFFIHLLNHWEHNGFIGYLDRLICRMQLYNLSVFSSQFTFILSLRSNYIYFCFYAQQCSLLSNEPFSRFSKEFLSLSIGRECVFLPVLNSYYTTIWFLKIQIFPSGTSSDPFLTKWAEIQYYESYSCQENITNFWNVRTVCIWSIAYLYNIA